MKIENVKTELEKLTKDKNNIDNRIIQLRDELITMEKNRDVLSGAIQTCNYFLKLDESEENHENINEDEKHKQEE